MKTALITGILGQDGTYLAELLTSKGYKVHGLVRRTAQPHPREGFVPKSAILHEGDATDMSSILAALRLSNPDEVYHLAGQSHVGRSFKEPRHTIEDTGISTLNVLEAVRLSGVWSRVYVASTSELFGGMSSEPCNEATPFRPRSPYGCAKLLSHSLAVNYREAYKLYVSCGILFNHESERRGHEFVTRKITLGIGKILRGLADTITLGNLEARRDWGYAPDYVDGMWRMLQQGQPDDYVLATGQAHSIRDFVDAAFDAAGLDPAKHVRIDPNLLRPAEVHTLVGDATKACQQLQWAPTTTFEQLVDRMVKHDAPTAPALAYTPREALGG